MCILICIHWNVNIPGWVAFQAAFQIFQISIPMYLKLGTDSKCISAHWVLWPEVDTPLLSIIIKLVCQIYGVFYICVFFYPMRHDVLRVVRVLLHLICITVMQHFVGEAFLYWKVLQGTFICIIISMLLNIMRGQSFWCAK